MTDSAGHILPAGIPVRLIEGGRLPTYAHDDDAAADCYARIAERVRLEPSARIRIPLGFALALPTHLHGEVRGRSGLVATHGILVAHGLIDPGYRGEVMALLVNVSDGPVDIFPGDRIAQLLIAPHVRARFTSVPELGQTERGNRGFGSTGR